MKITSTRTLDGVVLIWGEVADKNLHQVAVAIVGSHIAKNPGLADRYEAMRAFYDFALEQGDPYGSVDVFDPVAWKMINGVVYVTVGDLDGTDPKKAFDDYEKTIAAIAACIQNQRNG